MATDIERIAEELRAGDTRTMSPAAKILETISLAELDVIAERRRQVIVEGWSHEHDDEHTEGEMAMAAALYASPRDDLVVVEQDSDGAEYIDPWPWHDTVDVAVRGDCPMWGERPAWDKRKKHDRRRRLVIAGALLLAEIERLDRASQ